MPIISSGNGVKLETDMLVKILLEDFKNTAFSANKCVMYFSYLKPRDTRATDNTDGS
jgi:hypothetical protein